MDSESELQRRFWSKAGRSVPATKIVYLMHAYLRQNIDNFVLILGQNQFFEIIYGLPSKPCLYVLRLPREPACLCGHRAETPLTENYVVQVSSMHPTLSQDAVKDDVVNNCTANILTTLNDLFSAVNESRQFEHLGKYFNPGQKNAKCRLN